MMDYVYTTHSRPLCLGRPTLNIYRVNVLSFSPGWTFLWQDLKSFFIWWFVYVPLFAGIPMLYVTYLVFDLWRKKALQQIVRCTCPMLNRWALLTGHSSRVL